MSTFKRRTAVGAAILAAFLIAAFTATSAFATITPVQTDQAGDPTGTATDAMNLADAIAADPSQVTSADYVAVSPPLASNGPNDLTDPASWPHYGEQDGPVAIGDNSPGLASFPTAGATYGILTTGDPWLADQPNNNPDDGRSNGGPDQQRGDTDFDTTIFRIGVNVPNGANCVALDYRFLSEEFPEFVGSNFNDAFIAEVDNSTWTDSGSTISAPNDFATKTGNSGVSVNGVGPVAVFTAESAGTTYDAATGLVTTKTTITPGAHHIFLSIFDQGDSAYDSAAFVDNLRFITEDPSTCKPPEVAQAPPPPPPPAAPAPPPSNQITGSSIKFKNGATILTVNVPGPGNVTAGQASATAAAARADAAKKHKKHKKPVLIKKTSVVATHAGPVSLTIKPTAAGRKLLKKKGKFTVKTAITFAPNGGSPATTFRNVTIKVKKKHHKKH